ncbi:MAG: oxidoreductase, partial [Oxalobacteraceae bacterium]
LYAECVAVAAASGEPIPEDAQATALGTLLQAGSPGKASMLRDLEAGQRVEAAHIVGDMWHRAQSAGLAAPLLAAAWVHLQAYEAGIGTVHG